MSISKRSIPYMNFYMDWCTTNLKSFTYNHYDEFNEFLEHEYDLIWNGVNDIAFHDLKDETAFLLKWS